MEPVVDLPYICETWSINSRGHPISPTVISPRYWLASGAANPIFSATNVMVRVAVMHTPSDFPVSQSMPLGMSIAKTGAGILLTALTISPNGSRGDCDKPVPKIASTTNAASLGYGKRVGYRVPRRAIPSPARFPHFYFGVALVFCWIAGQDNLHIGTAIVQMPCDGQAIAAVVSAAAEDEHFAGAIVAHHRLAISRGGTRGVFHQDHAGDFKSASTASLSIWRTWALVRRIITSHLYPLADPSATGHFPRILPRPMLILLTNDDGISAPGLVAMYRELTAAG